MNERIRFHLDEPVDPVIARALKRHGVNVTTTAEAGLRSQNDDAQINFARAEGRVIVTHDADFLRFASENSDHPGIAYCHKTRRSIGDIVRGLILIFEALTPDEMTGRVEFL